MSGGGGGVNQVVDLLPGDAAAVMTVIAGESCNTCVFRPEK